MCCQGYGHVQGGKCAHYASSVICCLHSLSVLLPFGRGCRSKTPFNQFLFITLMHSLTKHINTLNYLYVHTYTHILSLQSVSCCPGKSTVGARSVLPIWPTGLRKRTRECHLISSVKTREFWQRFTSWVFFFVIQFIFCGCLIMKSRGGWPSLLTQRLHSVLFYKVISMRPTQATGLGNV